MHTGAGALVAVGMVLLVAGCGSHGSQTCTTTAETSSLPVLFDVQVLRTAGVPPAGVGATQARQFVFGGHGRTDADLREHIASELGRRGWRDARCTTAVEVCVRNATHFIGLVTRADAHGPGVPLGYPPAVQGRQGAQVLAVLEPNTCH